MSLEIIKLESADDYRCKETQRLIDECKENSEYWSKEDEEQIEWQVEKENLVTVKSIIDFIISDRRDKYKEAFSNKKSTKSTIEKLLMELSK